MPSKRTSEAAFETAIESILLADGYTRVDSKAFDRERALFPDEALAFIRAIQGKVWDKLEALHGEHTSARVLESLFIERMELNEELFTDYMAKPELQALVSKWLGGQVYDRLSAARRRIS
jgi:hypothetical protein